MALAPIDMLRKCREQFAFYACEHADKVENPELSADARNAAHVKGCVDLKFVDEIDATLKAWE